MTFRPDTARLPAFAGLLPVDEYQSADPAVAATLLRATGFKGAVFRLGDAGAADLGIFRIEAGPDPASWSVAKLAKGTLEHWTEIETILGELPADSPVLRCWPHYPKTLPDGRTLALFPWITARHPRPDPSDLHRIGWNLARLHRDLRVVRHASVIKRRAAARLEMLQRQAAKQDDADQLAPIPVAATLKRWPFDPLLADGQPLHGDCNAGNILLQADSNAVTFLDFEDLPHSWGSPLQDIAMIIERLCLVAAVEQAATPKLISSFAHGYASVSPLPSGSLARAMAFCNILAIAVLLGLARVGQSRPASEWRKFVDLLAELELREKAIDAAWQQQL